MWINQSHGDTLGYIPLIFRLKEKYPELDLIFCVFEEHAYYCQHLPAKIMTVKTPDTFEFRTSFEKYCPPDYIPINLWARDYDWDLKGHTWKNIVEVFNRRSTEKKLNYFLTSEPAYIELPKFDPSKIRFINDKFISGPLNINAKSIWVENGFCRSGHNIDAFDIVKWAELLPEFNFYTTSKVLTLNPNIKDMSELNFIDIQEISKHCKYIVGKGSGPFFTTFCEQNKNKLKFLVGFKPNI